MGISSLLYDNFTLTVKIKNRETSMCISGVQKLFLLVSKIEKY